MASAFVYNKCMSNRTRSTSRADLLGHERFLDSEPVISNHFPTSRTTPLGFIKNHIADSFTLLRIILGIALFWSGFVDGQAAPAKDIWLLVIAWSTDMVDGRISRSLKTAGKTWLGKQDVYVDMFVSLMALLYMAVTGLMGIGFIIAYLLIWGVVILRWGLQPLFAQVFQNPIYALFVFFAVQSMPSILRFLALWAGISLIFFWRRMIELIKNFINTVRK